MKQLLFLCSGNYYRSRFAEIYFNSLAGHDNLPWRASSRGLALNEANVGPISKYALARLRQYGLGDDGLRSFPQALSAADLAEADHVIAVKEVEHRHLIESGFRAWLDQVEFWNVHDIDCARPEEALPMLECEIRRLVERLARAAA
jgi:protein-tyrosine phosphatase